LYSDARHFTGVISSYDFNVLFAFRDGRQDFARVVRHLTPVEPIDVGQREFAVHE